MISSFDALSSEKRQIENILSHLSPVAFLDKMSLEARLRDVTLAIEELKLAEITPRAELTFRGAPVDGSHGVLASFGTVATKLFADAYSLAVASVKENLRYMGPVPERSNHELKITGVAIGSFGFTFELPAFKPDMLFDGETLEQKAVNLLINLMGSAASGDDDILADQVEKIHPRAAKKISEFMAHAASKEAVFALNSENNSVRFTDVEKLKESSKRLTSNYIHKYEESLVGTFLGVLPESRNFEYRVQENSDVIRGKLAPDIENPADLNEYVGRLVQVKFDVVQVGQGRPRYTLMTIDDLQTKVIF